jgi:hypothetical protein
MARSPERAIAIRADVGSAEQLQSDSARRDLKVVATVTGDERLARAEALIRDGTASMVYVNSLADLGDGVSEIIGGFVRILDAGGNIVCRSPDLDTRSPVDAGIAVFARALSSIDAPSRTNAKSAAIGQRARATPQEQPDYRRAAVLTALRSGVPIGQVARSFGIARREVERLAAGQQRRRTP